MAELEAFRENFYSTAAMLGGNSGGYMSFMPSGSLVAMTGLPYAGENYAIFNSDATHCEVAEAIDIFALRNIPFTAPQFPEVGEELAARLEANRLHVRKNYTAMVLERGGNYQRASSENTVNAADENSVRDWAETAWRGFGGDDVPESYFAFASYLFKVRENALYIYREDGIPAACALLHKSKKACGLYYFATLPSFRRRGIATKMLAFLAEEAFAEREFFVLLATEEGLPCYAKFGFRSLSNVPIRSAEEDI